MSDSHNPPTLQRPVGYRRAISSGTHRDPGQRLDRRLVFFLRIMCSRLRRQGSFYHWPRSPSIRSGEEEAFENHRLLLWQRHPSTSRIELVCKALGSVACDALGVRWFWLTPRFNEVIELMFSRHLMAQPLPSCRRRGSDAHPFYLGAGMDWRPVNGLQNKMEIAVRIWSIVSFGHTCSQSFPLRGPCFHM